jgi:CRP-like cAMP-binding protein
MNALALGSDDERAAAAGIFQDCPVAALSAGQVRPPTAFGDARLLVVERGIALVCSLPPEAERRMVLGVVGEGSILAPPGPHEHLLRLPEVADALVDGLVETIRDRQESLGQFASVRHANRIRGKLMQLARVHGRVVAGGIRLDLPLTHELLGEMVGSARETVTWAVGELMRDGLVVREGRRYRLVVEPDALAS